MDNREILYRGVTPDGKWVEGDLIQFYDKRFIRVEVIYPPQPNARVYQEHEVIPETVTQYWEGFRDHHGYRIFDGDVLLIRDGKTNDRLITDEDGRPARFFVKVLGGVFSLVGPSEVVLGPLTTMESLNWKPLVDGTVFSELIDKLKGEQK